MNSYVRMVIMRPWLMRMVIMQPWRMRNCFCTAQVFVCLCKIVSRPLKARKMREAGRLRKGRLRDRKQQRGQRMHAHEELCADGQTWCASPRLGVCLATSSTICITELKAHEKQRSRQEAYDKLTRPKTTESLRMCAYVLMYNQQLCAHGQAGYRQLLLLCQFLWLATSAKYWSQGAHEKQGRQEDKDQAFRKKTSLR